MNEELEAARARYDQARRDYDEWAPGPQMSYGVVVELDEAWQELVSVARATGPLACVFCDALYPPDSKTTDFQEHVRHCERHPLRAALEELAAIECAISADGICQVHALDADLRCAPALARAALAERSDA